MGQAEARFINPPVTLARRRAAPMGPTRRAGQLAQGGARGQAQALHHAGNLLALSNAGNKLQPFKHGTGQ